MTVPVTVPVYVVNVAPAENLNTHFSFEGSPELDWISDEKQRVGFYRTPEKAAKVKNDYLRYAEGFVAGLQVSVECILGKPLNCYEVRLPNSEIAEWSDLEYGGANEESALFSKVTQ